MYTSDCDWPTTSIVHQGIKYQKLTVFCKPHTFMMNVVINAVFSVDVYTTITHLLHPMLHWKHKAISRYFTKLVFTYFASSVFYIRILKTVSYDPLHKSYWLNLGNLLWNKCYSKNVILKQFRKNASVVSKSINNIPIIITCFPKRMFNKSYWLNISISFKSYQHLLDKMINVVQIFHLVFIMMTTILVNLKLIFGFNWSLLISEVESSYYYYCNYSTIEFLNCSGTDSNHIF